ncbi:unnamed protein product [Cylindrotheca closterium]|uniref:Nudix hydrolase domain-containing protein n=1 Tax=Cylindrotheca closterium TaxID=2856 RepID=A0AAD2G021_9STRA|nr:unnamed protein product [Cylindrotheca closterium]
MRILSSPILFIIVSFLANCVIQAFCTIPPSLPASKKCGESIQTKNTLQLRGGSEDGDEESSSSFEILDEKIAYSGWRTIVQRKVKMRNGKVVDFDLVGVKTGDAAVLVFAFDTKTKTATLIREYMPASHKVLWGVGAGLIEEKHGHDAYLAAQHELEEECHLTGGEWIPLTNAATAMDKYALTNIHAYLVLNPEPAINPKPLDDEEDIEIVPGVAIGEIMEYIANGEMNLVGGWGCMLAISKLRELNLI